MYSKKTYLIFLVDDEIGETGKHSGILENPARKEIMPNGISELATLHIRVVRLSPEIEQELII